MFFNHFQKNIFDLGSVNIKVFSLKKYIVNTEKITLIRTSHEEYHKDKKNTNVQKYYKNFNKSLKFEHDTRTILKSPFLSFQNSHLNILIVILTLWM